MRIFLSILLLPLLTAPAHAHWGHVGELAGHGHVIAIGALVGAAALAAALYGLRDKDTEEPSEDEVETEEEPA